MITDMSSDVENEEEAVVNEKTIVKRLEKTCPLLRRIRAVIEWLEGIARESDYLRTVRESMSSFSEKCANWEHTFHYLKSSNSINKKDKVFFSGRDFVTELVIKKSISNYLNIALIKLGIYIGSRRADSSKQVTSRPRPRRRVQDNGVHIRFH